MGANSQLALCILIAASGATSTLISKMSLVLRISEPRGEVGPILVQAASHWTARQSPLGVAGPTLERE